MSEEKTTQATLSLPITTMIEELVRFRNNTWKWVDQPHSLKDTEARKKELQAMSVDLSELADAVLKQNLDTSILDQELNANLRIIEIAHGYMKEISECLKEDYDAKKKENGENKVDVVKNAAFLIATPAAFVAGVKNGVGNGHIDANEALILGFVVAVPVVYHKKVASLFAKAKKVICDVPATIRALPAAAGNDMRVVYVREIIKDRTHDAKTCYSVVAKSINDNIQTGKRQTASLMKRVFGGRGPRPGA